MTIATGAPAAIGQCFGGPASAASTRAITSGVSFATTSSAFRFSTHLGEVGSRR